jgi:phage tail-like protein
MSWINKAVQNFKFEPKMVNVMLMNEKGDTLVNWSFQNAYPVSVKVSDLNSTENKYAIETLELAYDYYERTDQKT